MIPPSFPLSQRSRRSRETEPPWKKTCTTPLFGYGVPKVRGRPTDWLIDLEQAFDEWEYYNLRGRDGRRQRAASTD
ncbi:hypothetical protein GCM10011499_21430 [Pelagibacterium lentulum]|uniref:Uncharacterized protein n=1 Tax=Pelagibacterium lentulum TaxID=2029865 RepID=A0A916RC10_9HYPH|nr:hypothetical protein GCM10011499_21430 [Pelagibacterium lentulum]